MYMVPYYIILILLFHNISRKHKASFKINHYVQKVVNCTCPNKVGVGIPGVQQAPQPAFLQSVCPTPATPGLSSDALWFSGDRR